jgi:hypothetical protein
MHGTDRRLGELFSYINLEARVRAHHPVRSVRTVAEEALGAPSSDFRCAMIRPGTAFDRVGDAAGSLLFGTIGAAADGAVEIDLLFRWFVGLGMEEPVWDHSTFSKNRDRLLAGEIAAKFLSAILKRPRVRRLLSSDHFSVDGTLIEASASMKSFRPRDDDPPRRRR